MLKTIAGVATVAAILPLVFQEPASFITLPQHDEWRSAHDSPAVSVSANGRYIAFASYAQLVPADINRQRDVYVLDRTTGQVTLESVTTDGRPAGSDSERPRISADGQVLVYQTNGVSPSDWTTSHIVLRRRDDGTTTVITVRDGAASERWWGHSAVVSGDGRVVVFVSSANLIPGAPANGHRAELYAYDVASGSLRRVAIDAPSSIRSSVAPAINHDGRHISFTSAARGTASEVFVWDAALSVRRPIRADGRAPNGASWSTAMDGAGRHLAFVSAATNLVAGDRNRAPDVFVADTRSGDIELISRSAGGGSANGASAAPALSADGRFVAFQSDASDLVCAKNCAAAQEDINLLWDVFLYDRSTRRMSCLSAGPDGWMEASAGPALNARGDVIAFSSRHPIDGNDVRNDFDLFVRVNAPPSGQRHPPLFQPGVRDQNVRLARSLR